MSPIIAEKRKNDEEILVVRSALVAPASRARPGIVALVHRVIEPEACARDVALVFFHVNATQRIRSVLIRTRADPKGRQNKVGKTNFTLNS